jgi:hypothetical protein
MKQPSRQVHTQVKKQFFTATGVGPSPPKKKKGGDTLSLLSRFTSPPTTDTNLPLTHRSPWARLTQRFQHTNYDQPP